MTTQNILNQLLIDENLTVEELAEKTQTSVSSLYRAIKGETKKLHNTTVEKITKVYPVLNEKFNILKRVDSISSDTEKTYVKGEIVLIPRQKVITIDEMVSFLSKNYDECLQNEKFFLWTKNIGFKEAINILRKKDILEE